MIALRPHQIVACLALTAGCLFSSGATAQDYLTGDVNCNGAVNFIDAVDLLRHLTSTASLPAGCDCQSAQDVNGDNAVNIPDAIDLLNYAITGGPLPVAPFPVCGPGASALACVSYPSPCPLFKRGDANQDGCVSSDDAIFIANYLTSTGPAPLCMLAADANDDDAVTISDVAFIQAFCIGGTPPPAPGALVCGPDPTPGTLTCGSYPQSACNSGCRNQLPNDMNQDGGLDISDPVGLLNHMVVGIGALPCGDGTSGDPRNIQMFDSNGDYALDISDVIWFLNWMFGAGAAPINGTTCTYFEGCPQNPSCPDCTP